jgi:lysine 2,3-aminomutase
VEHGDELALERQYEYYDPIYVLPEAGQAWWRAHADASVSAVGAVS